MNFGAKILHFFYICKKKTEKSPDLSDFSSFVHRTLYILTFVLRTSLHEGALYVVHLTVVEDVELTVDEEFDSLTPTLP